MKFSAFGEKFTSQAGITSLMEDLGHALASGSELIMMGGGNPAHIPEVQAHFHRRLSAILESKRDFQRLVGIYDPPQGDLEFIRAVRDLLNGLYGWGLSDANIGLTNGSQAAFFMLFNLFAGDFADGSRKHIKLPLAPEYIGYSDAGLSPEFFSANRPLIESLDAHTFKYRIDFEQFQVAQSCGAICASRPSNPTGNVLTDAEVERLGRLAKANKVPLILDGAYGIPFPNLIFTEARPIWDDNTILCLSLSKFGLPAARTGIVIADEKVIKAMAGVNAILNLATGSFGSMVAYDLVQSGDIVRLSETVIKPYYWTKAQRAESLLKQHLSGLPFALHKVEGAMFLWLWLADCPITSQQLYERLKQRGVLVVSGHHFFPGLNAPADLAWRHRHECLRITYSQDEQLVEKGLAIIGDEIRRVYQVESA